MRFSAGNQVLFVALLLVCVLSTFAGAVAADGVSVWTVAWPQEEPHLVATLTLHHADGTLSLAVQRSGMTVIEPSPIGVVTEQADYSRGLRFIERADRIVTEEYTTVSGKRRERRSEMVEAVFSFSGANGTPIDVIIRVAEDGVAYRYRLPAPGAKTVRRETGAFVVPDNAAAWLNPYRNNYENRYTTTTAAGAALQDYAYPALFQVGETFILLSESDVDGRYPASRLAHRTRTGRYDIQLADLLVPAAGPLTTPWRVAIIGDLATIVESTLTDDLAPPAQIADTSWIRPGRVAWSWLAGYEGAQRSLQTQQEFVDYAAARGWEYVLVDAGWYLEDWAPEIIDYARQRDVGIILWVHWTDLDTPEKSQAFFDRIVAWGAAGVKIDFMDSDSRERFQWYDRILAETAERNLLVNFHGSTIPHGIQRTWPHVMTMEAVYGEEQGNHPIAHVMALPYTRNVIGSMDYTPMRLHRRDGLEVSEAGELALSVIYESAQQHYAGSIESYRARPELERFLEQVPTVWDDTRLLDGYPGERIIIARRQGTRWFIGAIAARPALVLELPLTLFSGEWLLEVVRDGAEGLVREQHIVHGPDGHVSIPIVANGGFAAIACPLAEGVTTCDLPQDKLPLPEVSIRLDPLYAEPGGTVELSVNFAVHDLGPVADVNVRVEVPEGWTLAGEDIAAEQLQAGQQIAGIFYVTVPAGRETYHDVLEVAIEYVVVDANGDERTLRIERQVPVVVRAPYIHYVSDMTFLVESNGWGPVERDMTNAGRQARDGSPLSIRGETYAKGLGVHAPSEVVVLLQRRYERFAATVGVDDLQTGTIVFEVIGDGEVLLRTPVLTVFDPPYAIDVDVSGVNALLLRVTDGGDGNSHDHGIWADAKLYLNQH